MQFIQYIYTNINRVLDFCEGKAEFFSQLRVSSVKENLQLVRPLDFIFKSSSGNFFIMSREQFFASFKKAENFIPECLTYPCILKL